MQQCLTQAYCIYQAQNLRLCESVVRVLLQYRLSQKDARRFRHKQITGYAAVCSCIVSIMLQSRAVMMNILRGVLPSAGCKDGTNSPLKMKLKSLPSSVSLAFFSQ
jgi:hypothetical protein